MSSFWEGLFVALAGGIGIAIICALIGTPWWFGMIPAAIWGWNSQAIAKKLF